MQLCCQLAGIAKQCSLAACCSSVSASQASDLHHILIAMLCTFSDMSIHHILCPAKWYQQDELKSLLHSALPLMWEQVMEKQLEQEAG